MPNLKSVMAGPALGRRRRSLGRRRAGTGAGPGRRRGAPGGPGRRAGVGARRDEAGPGSGRRRLAPAGPATRRRCRRRRRRRRRRLCCRAHHREPSRRRGAARTHPRPPPTRQSQGAHCAGRRAPPRRGQWEEGECAGALRSGGSAGEGSGRGRRLRGRPALRQFRGKLCAGGRAPAPCSRVPAQGWDPAPDPTPGPGPRTWLLAPRPALRPPVSRPASHPQAVPCDPHRATFDPARHPLAEGRAGGPRWLGFQRDLLRAPIRRTTGRRRGVGGAAV